MSKISRTIAMPEQPHNITIEERDIPPPLYETNTGYVHIVEYERMRRIVNILQHDLALANTRKIYLEEENKLLKVERSRKQCLYDVVMEYKDLSDPVLCSDGHSSAAGVCTIAKRQSVSSSTV